MPRPLARHSLIPVLVVGGASFALAAGAGATLVRAVAPSAHVASARAQTIAPRGPVGPVGPVGPAGGQGDVGPPGLAGPAGHQPVYTQSITINWENGHSQGRDTASFVVPGLGTGYVQCNEVDPNEEIVFVPTDPTSPTALAGTQIDTTDTNRAPLVSPQYAVIQEPESGPEADLGLNIYNQGDGGTLQPQGIGTGSYIGVISSRADGSTVAPTVFRLTYNWNYNDGDPRCYVAGTLTTSQG